MQKIFQIITSVQVGGAENVAFSIAEGCNEFSENKFEFMVLELFRTSNPYADQKRASLKVKGIDVITLSRFGKRLSLLFAPFTLLRYIRREKPDIIHAHTDLPDFVLSVALRLTGKKKIKIVRTIHNTELWADHQKVGRFVESAFENDTIIGVSKAAVIAYKNLREGYQLPVSPLTSIIYNGCEKHADQPHDFKIDQTKINIAYCGRFFYQKGIDILVRLIDQVCTKYPDKFFFHIIGEGVLEDGIQQLSERRADVLFYGSIPQMSSKLYPFDFLLMPSRFEGLPLISIEASLSHVPVIASRADGLVETLPADWPLFFDLNDLPQFFIIIDRVLAGNYGDMQMLKETAYQFASTQFARSKMIASYSKIFSDILTEE